MQGMGQAMLKKKTVVGFSDCIGVCCDKIENRDHVVAQL